MRLLSTLSFVIPVLLLVAEEDKADIRVLNAQGEWTRLDNQGHPVRINTYDRFPAGQVNCKGPNGTLEVLAGYKAKTLKCLATQNVTVEQEDPNQKEFPFFTAVHRLIVKGPALYTPTMARGGTAIPDAVLIVEKDGTFDASALIANLRPGRYRLKFSGLQQGSENTVSAEVDSLHPKATAEDVKPGPYRLRVVTADDDESDAGPWAAVFLTIPGDPNGAVKAFTEAAKASADLSPEARRALMVLTSAALAENSR